MQEKDLFQPILENPEKCFMSKDSFDKIEPWDAAL